ncbi:MAG: hypothetical protein WBY44_20610 [Bryobacteraceae bacterium]
MTNESRELFWIGRRAVVGPTSPADREAHWRQDLQFFVEHFSNGHCAPADLFQSPLTALQPDALYPDIAAPRTLGDFLPGRDPALDAALHSQARRAK